jgi:hypothetical protein
MIATPRNPMLEKFGICASFLDFEPKGMRIKPSNSELPISDFMSASLLINKIYTKDNNFK